jgi:hypothetical protein
MAACCAPLGGGTRLPAMASLAVLRPRAHGPRLIERPQLFGRARMTIADLVGLVWLATEVARFVQSRVEAPSRGRGGTRAKERVTWSQ